MQLRKETVCVLRNMSAINPNLVIKPGTKIETVSTSKDVIASFVSDDEFDTKMSFFNLGEFLGVLGAFEKPELDLEDKFVTISQGKQKVKYVYADESLLIVPPENQSKIEAALENPPVSFSLSDTTLARLQKMAGILGVEDLAVVGNGKKITLVIYNKKDPTCNEFEIDTEVETGDTFHINFKIEKLKLFPGAYDIDISKRIARFKHGSMKLHYYIAVESDSEFN